MNLTENFESVKKFAVDAAQTATQKAKILAAVAKGKCFDLRRGGQDPQGRSAAR